MSLLKIAQLRNLEVLILTVGLKQEVGNHKLGFLEHLLAQIEHLISDRKHLGVVSENKVSLHQQLC